MRISLALGSFFWRIRFFRRVQIAAKTNVSFRAILDPSSGTIKIGSRSRISFGACLLSEGGDISIGNYCTVNPYTIIYGHGGTKIGDSVRIASHVTIIPSNHNYMDANTPIRLQRSTSKGITIEDDVWIGTHAVILDGAHVGKGCVIAAGSVVRGTLEPFGVYAGSPARLIKFRNR